MKKINKMKLIEPISFELYYEDGLWIFEFSPLLIYAFGKTIKSAKKNLEIQLNELKDFFLNTPEEKISKKAINYKSCFVDKDVEKS